MTTHEHGTTTADPRKVVTRAQRDGTIRWDQLDVLLEHEAAADDQLAALVDDLDGVLVVPSKHDADVLNIRPRPIDEMESSRSHFNLYAKAIRDMPRMTREEEHLLARRLAFARLRIARALQHVSLPEDVEQLILEHGTAGRELDTRLAEEERLESDRLRGRRNRLPDANAWSVLRAACDVYGGLRACFVERNLYLVISLCSAYRTYGVPMMDLIQEGNAALIRAVEKFDWRKGVRFQTYGVLWVRQAVERLTTANRGIVRVPNYVQQKMRRLRREGKLPRNLRDMDVRDVTEHFDTTLEAAVRLMETDRPSYSIDGMVGDSDDSFASLLEAEEGEETLANGEKELLGERLREVMRETLTDQECSILEQRFGLGGASPRTLDQIGQELSVSRERVRQMQVKALGKLQKERLREALEDFL